MASTPVLRSLSGDARVAAAPAAKAGARRDPVAPAAFDKPQPVAATATRINRGKDTLITFVDGSTILVKGVAAIEAMFFA